MVLLKLRRELDANGMKDKQIGFTTRYNSFWKEAPSGWTPWPSDGEAIIVDNHLKDQGSSISDTVNWVNLMVYDQSPSDFGSPSGITIDTFKTVVTAVEKIVRKDRIVIGLEPGKQANDGKWEGLQTDKDIIDWVS